MLKVWTTQSTRGALKTQETQKKKAVIIPPNCRVRGSELLRQEAYLVGPNQYSYSLSLGIRMKAKSSLQNVCGMSMFAGTTI